MIETDRHSEGCQNDNGVEKEKEGWGEKNWDGKKEGDERM